MKPFNAKLWGALVNPSFEIGALDHETAKAAYLAQYAHKESGCGGSPRTENGAILCAACGKRWRWVGPLKKALAKLPFRSMKL